MSRRLAAELRLGLHQHLPGVAEQVEVVHVQAAEKRLQRVVGVGERDAQGLQLVGVHVHVVTRHVGAEGADHVAEFGTLAGRLHQRDRRRCARSRHRRRRDLPA